MTPKEKAEELYGKFDMIIYTDQDYKSQCKRCAIRAVNEIIDAYYYLEVEVLHTQFGEILNKINGEIRIKYNKFVMYWELVKQEIEKL
jgi:hypothetical protein